MPKRKASDTGARADAAPAAASFEGFPEAPDEKHLTVEGAILDSFGKLEAVAYTSLKDHFANEPHRDLHPVHENPGTKAEEQGQLEGLKWWSDPRGEGWKASLNGKEKCLSVGKWGSWRLAFLLARLQLDVWLKGREVASSSHSPRPSLQKPKAAKEAKEAKEAKVAKEAKAAEAPKEAKAARESKHAGEAKEAKEAKAAKETKAAEAPKEAKAARESKAGEAKEAKAVVQAQADEAAKEPQPRAALVQKTLDVHMKPGMHPELLPEERRANREVEANNAATRDAVAKMKGEPALDATQTTSSPAKKLRRQNVDFDSPAVAAAAPRVRQDQAKTGEAVSASSIIAPPQSQSSRSGEGLVASPASSSSRRFPAEPEDARLTVDGAILEENGKLMVKEYIVFKSYFEHEAPVETHPVPTKPGITLEEKDQLAGLRSWSDAKGKGWIATGHGLNKWFNANTWGSWRLAFVLARLQVAVWSKREGAEGASRPATRQKVGLRKTPKMKKVKVGFGKVRKAKGKLLRGRPTPISRVVASRREPRNSTAPAHAETGLPADGKRPRGRPRGRFVPRSIARRAQAAHEDDDTPLAQLLPPKMKEGFRMDPRSKLIQQKRRDKAGLKSKSSFDALGEVIDEARSKTQLDIHILAGASFEELDEIGVSNALTVEELSALASRRRVAADSAPSSSSSSSAALPETGAHRTSAADDDLLAQCRDEVHQRALENGSEASPTAAVPHSTPAVQATPPSNLGSSSDAVFNGAKNGPETVEEVDAVIAELLKIGAIY